MKIFVAGATGVMGRRLVPALVEAGHAVTAAGRSPEKRAWLHEIGARPAEVDLFDPQAVREAVAGHETVINLATRIPPMAKMAFPWAWRTNDRLRREAAHILAQAALAGGAERFIQESFAPVYPDSGGEWITEETALQPVLTNRTVLDAEDSAAAFTRAGGSGVVLRFAFFYGPDSETTRAMIADARRGRFMLLGPPEGFFSMLSHDDAAAAVAAALAVPAGVYNVVEDRPLRRREIAAALGEALGVPAPRPLPGWAARLMGPVGALMVRSVRISNRKFREASGWAPQYASLAEGLPAVLAEMGERRMVESTV